MKPDISCRSLTQIQLQITRWLTKCRPCKAIAISQAFIFNFKCYRILYFAVCQLLRWPLLLPLKLMQEHAIATEQKISQNLSWTNRYICTKICRPYNYKANKVIWRKFSVPIFYEIKCEIKKMVTVNYVYYIFFEIVHCLACFNVPLMLVNMEARNRLVLD